MCDTGICQKEARFFHADMHWRAIDEFAARVKAERLAADEMQSPIAKAECPK
jgi:hypothetical protein